jgi:hypothetical protein
MGEEVRRQGQDLVLVFLPGHQDLRRLRREELYREDWRSMVASVCRGEQACIDLWGDLERAPEGLLDRGYDGTHYGPRASRLIAELIGAGLRRSGLLPSARVAGSPPDP